MAAFGGRPACPFFSDEQEDAVAQLEHSLLHSSSAFFDEVLFFAMVSLEYILIVYSYQLSPLDNKDVEINTASCEKTVHYTGP